MAISVPVAGQDITAEDFAIPVVNQLNGIVPTVWTNVTLLSGWTHTSGSPLQYRKVGDIVQIRGRADGSSGPWTTIFNAPAGYRPPSDVMVGLAVVMSSAWGVQPFSVSASGVFTFVGSGTVTSVAPNFAYSVTV
ncbi:MAG: hypothetical protein ABWY25_09365 [Paenisporosarcina sp.]